MSWTESIDWDDPDSLRAWAWRTDDDEDYDQLDDVLCESWEHLPQFLTLAADPACPKGSYILGALDNFFRDEIIKFRRNPAGVTDALKLAASLDSAPVQEWAHRQERRLRHRAGSGPIDQVAARTAADDLLFGPFRPPQPLTERQSVRAWIFENDLGHFKELLAFDKKSGAAEYWMEGMNRNRILP